MIQKRKGPRRICGFLRGHHHPIFDCARFQGYEIEYALVTRMAAQSAPTTQKKSRRPSACAQKRRSWLGILADNSLALAPLAEGLVGLFTLFLANDNCCNIIDPEVCPCQWIDLGGVGQSQARGWKVPEARGRKRQGLRSSPLRHAPLARSECATFWEKMGKFESPQRVQF